MKEVLAQVGGRYPYDIWEGSGNEIGLMAVNAYSNSSTDS